MNQRILCPFHKERTPSCVLYKTKYICFGCGAEGPLSDLDLKDVKVCQYEKKPKEDIEKSLSYIRTLRSKFIRGINFPYDDKYYYIVWPNAPFYKKRRLDTDTGSKYLHPRGHKPPLFVANETDNKTLLIIEGEINSLSLVKAGIKYPICSPGSATDFYGKKYDEYKEYYLQYKRFCIIVDKDGAGIKAAIELKTKLLQHTPYINVILMDGMDANDLLTKMGPEYLKAKMEMLLRETI